jgi:hypothetical protein
MARSMAGMISATVMSPLLSRAISPYTTFLKNLRCLLLRAVDLVAASYLRAWTDGGHSLHFQAGAE